MNIERRDFFKILSVGAASALAGKPAAARGWQHKGRSPEAPAILYDATLCIGCKVCEVGCKKANNLPVDPSELNVYHGVPNAWDSSPDLSPNSYLKIKLYRNGKGTAPNQGTDGFSFIRSACMHCAEPDCQSVCPTSALLKDPDTGIVTWDEEACCGCRYCQMACPFLVPKFEYDKPFPRLQKCFLCNHRLQQGEIPGCCEACPTGATIFGSFESVLNEAKKRIAAQPGSEYHFPVNTVDSLQKLVKKTARYMDYVYGEKEGGGTQYIVLASVPYDKLGLPKLPPYSSGSKSESLQHSLYNKMIAPLVLFGGLMAAAYRSVNKNHKAE